VVDVGHGPGIGSRAASDDPAVVTSYGTAVAQGIRDAGLLPVLKHFPGHGQATGDTHDTVAVGPSIDELREVDLVPFAEVLDALAPEPVGVLVGHTTVPGLVDEPASQAPEVIDGLLREELGFDGLVVSDALGMAAAGQPDQGSALVGFLRSGGDLGIIGPGGSIEGRRAVRAALAEGTLTVEQVDRAALRVFAAKGLDPCAVAPDDPPEVEQDPGPSDDPVVNPTEVP
jgi:beta-N-acetylhexosaminidase